MTEEDEDILIYNLNQLTEVVSENHQSIKNILKRTDKLERLAQQQLISFFLLWGAIIIGGMMEIYFSVMTLS